MPRKPNPEPTESPELTQARAELNQYRCTQAELEQFVATLRERQRLLHRPDRYCHDMSSVSEALTGVVTESLRVIDNLNRRVAREVLVVSRMEEVQSRRGRRKT